MKKDLFIILLSCFLGLTFSSCGDGSEPENSGEVEQTAPAWAIGVWETVGDAKETIQTEDGEEFEESYEKNFEITESSFQYLQYEETPEGELRPVEMPIYVFGKEQTLEVTNYDGSTRQYTAKYAVSKRTDKEFVLDSYIDGENLGPHFVLEKDGDKFYYRDWDGETDKLTEDRWEVVKK